MTLMDRVADYKNIHLAYLRVIKGQMNRELLISQEEYQFSIRVPEIYDRIRGIFQIGLNDEFEFRCIEQLDKPKRQMEDSTWATRPLARMGFFDAVVAQCVINILSEQLKTLLPTKNYAYRILDSQSLYLYEDWKTGYKRFVQAELDAIKCGRFSHVLETDISNFYPMIRHDRLLEGIKAYIGGQGSNEINDVSVFMGWIRKILGIPVKTCEGVFSSLVGIPQGPLYSPILAMFYIKDLIGSVSKRQPRALCFAYVDDIRIYCEKEEHATELRAYVYDFMEGIGLRLSESKTQIIPVTKGKEIESKIMSRASNLNRAIRDDVIMTVNGKKEIKHRLLELVTEARNATTDEDDLGGKFLDRIRAFVDYRLVKLIESPEDWYEGLEETFDGNTLNNSMVAIWHILYLNADSPTQKREFVRKLEEVLESTSHELSYVKYLVLQYLFRWSPSELRYSNQEAKLFTERHLQSATHDVFLKAIMSKMHVDWYQVFKSVAKRFISKSINDTELRVLLSMVGFAVELPEPYKSLDVVNHRIVLDGSNIAYESFTPALSGMSTFMDTENFKNISYMKMNEYQNTWTANFDSNLDCLSDMRRSIKEDFTRNFLKRLFGWLNVQLTYESKRVPCSVVDPNHIWINRFTGQIVLYGNPSMEQDIFFTNRNNAIWRTALERLFSVLFNLDVLQGQKKVAFMFATPDGASPLLKKWQYRILRFLYSRRFSLEQFVSKTLEIVEQDDYTSITHEQLLVDRLVAYYIPDVSLQDNLIQVANFVENSWNNGAKDTYFYTLHNHEHARYLIHKIHELFERTTFSIYINSKEALRLFAACYLHDIGMLSEPKRQRLHDDTKSDVQVLVKDVSSIVEVAASRAIYLPHTPHLELSHIYEIHHMVDRLREQIVRTEHPFVSEKELVSDYPRLPLSVAERRDIGIIGASHGQEKQDVSVIPEQLHDYRHPINLRLLSLLLRIADLSDVSKLRVRREILDRNHARMGNYSIFHWIKHLSVDDLTMTRCKTSLTSKTIVSLNVEHNYLPTGNLPSGTLKKRCGCNCKLLFKEPAIQDFVKDGQAVIGDDSYVNYFDPSLCNITCAFINEAYRYFFTEIIYINEYLNRKGIEVELRLNIKLKENNRQDFKYVNNRNDTISAQEFMFHFFQ